MKNNIKGLLFVALSFVACNSSDDSSTPTETPITPGTAIFTNYVALGDSFAAGYSDNALFMTGQDGAYTNILSQQFAAAGGGDFITPYTNDNIGGLLLQGNVIIADTRLYFNGSAPVSVTGPPTTEVTNHLSGSFNNLGIPGAKSYHLLAPGYGNVAGVASGAANPYFARFASSPSTTVLADALKQSPTFFTLWIGGNDVLGYATSGGVGVNQTGNYDPSTYGSTDITDPIVYATAFNTLAQKLSENGAKGAVANLPYVSTLPYFTTVPFNPLPLSAAVAAQLNAGYAQYNGGLQFAVSNGLITAAEATKRTIKFIEGKNAVVIIDSYLTNLSGYGIPSYRQATKSDLLVLTSSSIIGTTVGGNASLVYGASVPLEDKWVLTVDEINEVKVATDAYNTTIKEVAVKYNLAFVDTKITMTQLSTSGIIFGNYQMTAKFVTGGAFSLDGVHPSARGYALIANVFADAINKQYGSTLKSVDLAKYQIQYQQVLP